MMASISNNPFLEAQDVKTHFPIEKGILLKRRVGSVKAIDGVSFSLEKGKILGLVGESGCGKSTLARTLLQLIPPTAGAVRINGQDVTSLSAGDLRSARCRDAHTPPKTTKPRQVRTKTSRQTPQETSLGK